MYAKGGCPAAGTLAPTGVGELVSLVNPDPTAARRAFTQERHMHEWPWLWPGPFLDIFSKQEEEFDSLLEAKRKNGASKLTDEGGTRREAAGVGVDCHGGGSGREAVRGELRGSKTRVGRKLFDY